MYYFTMDAPQKSHRLDGLNLFIFSKFWILNM